MFDIAMCGSTLGGRGAGDRRGESISRNEVDSRYDRARIVTYNYDR